MTRRQRTVWWALTVTAIGLLVTYTVWAAIVLPYADAPGWIMTGSVGASFTAVILRHQWARRAEQVRADPTGNDGAAG